MKILIFHATYGGGHLSAAKAIQSVLYNHYPQVEIEMVDCIEYVNKYINKMTTTAYTEMTKKVPWAWGKVYYHSKKGAMAKFSKATNKILALKLQKLIKEISPDIIISTHPFATQMCAFLKKHKKIDIKVATILTDFKMHEQWLVGYNYIEYFFVSNNNMKDSLVMYGVPLDRVYVTGIPISMRFSENFNKDEILNEFGLKENIKTVLFFARWQAWTCKKRCIRFYRNICKRL